MSITSFDINELNSLLKLLGDEFRLINISCDFITSDIKFTFKFYFEEITPLIADSIQSIISQIKGKYPDLYRFDSFGNVDDGPYGYLFLISKSFVKVKESQM